MLPIQLSVQLSGLILFEGAFIIVQDPNARA